MFFGSNNPLSSNGQNANQQAQKRMAIAQMEQELAMTDFLFQK